MAALHYLLNFSEKSKTILKKIKPTNKKYKTESKDPCMKTSDGQSFDFCQPPVPQNVTIFGDRTFKEVSKLK